LLICIETLARATPGRAVILAKLGAGEEWWGFNSPLLPLPEERATR